MAVYRYLQFPRERAFEDSKYGDNIHGMLSDFGHLQCTCIRKYDSLFTYSSQEKRAFEEGEYGDNRLDKPQGKHDGQGQSPHKHGDYIYMPVCKSEANFVIQQKLVLQKGVIT